MKINFFFALSLVLFAACLVLDILGVVRCRKRGEEIGNRLMLECILHNAANSVHCVVDVLNEKTPDAF